MGNVIKKLAVNLGLVALSLALTLFIIEVGLRLFYPASERDWSAIHRPDSELGWAYIPDSSQWYTSPGEFRTFIQINANGQRDEPRSYQKPADTYRMIMLGDSFVASLQTPLTQTFVKETEDHFRQRSVQPGYRIEVLNAGTGGYGTDQELRWFRKDGVRYAPDCVVLIIFLGNDIADNDFELWYLNTPLTPPKPFFRLAQGTLYDAGFSGAPSELSGDQEVSVLSLRRFLQRYSYTFTMTSAMLARLEGKPAFQTALTWLGRGGAANTYNHSYDIFAATPPPAWERAWAITEALILALRDEVEASGAEFRVVLLPHPVQVQRDWWAARLSLYPAMAQIQWDLLQPNAHLANFFEAHRIAYLDVYPELAGYVKRTGAYLYYRSDGHFTPEGNQIVGQAIADWLAETERWRTVSSE